MGGGGGGTQRQTTTTTPTTPPELRGAYQAAGNLAENMMEGMDYLPGQLQDTTVQQVAGPTDIELAAQENAMNMLNGPQPEAWDDAASTLDRANRQLGHATGFFNRAGRMDQFQAQDYNREGNIRDIESFDMDAWMNKAGRGGGGGGGSFSYSGGGGGAAPEMERIGNPLESIDFANHPALQSALYTFAKTALPGIENSMIGAGLGRSGAAANAIATGKAEMALPLITQLIQGELTNKGMDVQQRQQDINAQMAAQSAAASAAAQGASLAQQRYMADLAHAQTMRAQDIQLRGQDIGMNQQQIDAMIAEDQQNFAAQQQQQNALISAGQGMTGVAAGTTGVAAGQTNLSQAQTDYAQENIQGAMGIGNQMRGITNAQNEAEFLASQRPWERGMQVLDPILGGAMGQTGQTATSTTTGGGGK